MQKQPLGMLGSCKLYSQRSAVEFGVQVLGLQATCNSELESSEYLQCSHENTGFAIHINHSVVGTWSLHTRELRGAVCEGDWWQTGAIRSDTACFYLRTH